MKPINAFINFNILLGFVFFPNYSYCDVEYKFEKEKYKIHYVPDLRAYFYIDDIPDGIKDHLRQGIYWESRIGHLIAKYTKRHSTVVDIGAHIGIHSITMSRKVGKNGKVIAFEPQKKMYAEQLENLRINRCKNVTSIRKALGETYKTIELDARNLENEGGTAIGKGGDIAEMITLDSLNLTNVSLIKLDVERYEYFVFQGAKNTILRNKPVIIFELLAGDDYNNCSQEVRAEFDKVISFVESLGYRVELIFGNDYIAFPYKH